MLCINKKYLSYCLVVMATVLIYEGIHISPWIRQTYVGLNLLNAAPITTVGKELKPQAVINDVTQTTKTAIGRQGDLQEVINDVTQPTKTAIGRQGDLQEVINDVTQITQTAIGRHGDLQEVINGVLESREQCPSVVKYMLQGTWQPRPMTSEQTKEIKKFLEVSRSHHHLPKSLQRKDLMCGNVSFLPIHKFSWFKAQCDPYGNTPCCYANKCVAKSMKDCKCDKCQDMRRPVHAEYADWTPFDRRCQPKIYTHIEACELVGNSTLYISGDSYMRQLYTAVLLFFRNNTHDGAMKQGIHKDIHDQCTGMYMFTHIVCRFHLDPPEKVTDLCGGSLTIQYQFNRISSTGPNLVKHLRGLKGRRKTLVVFGIGAHDKYNADIVKKKYILPAMQTRGKNVWPRFVWAMPHHPGLLYNGHFKGPTEQFIQDYISDIQTYLTGLGIPVIDNYNFTKGIVSFDGSHFGLGLNMWKIQIILNYINELKNGDAWN